MLLRKAVEEVLTGQAKAEPGLALGDAGPLPILGPPGEEAGETHGRRLDEQLRNSTIGATSLWSPKTAPFDLIERPLRSWLDWNGSDDEIREDEILQGRIDQREKMAAAEHKANDTLLLLQRRSAYMSTPSSRCSGTPR